MYYNNITERYETESFLRILSNHNSVEKSINVRVYVLGKNRFSIDNLI